MHMMQAHPHYAIPHNPYAVMPPPPPHIAQQPHVKSEPLDNRYMLSGPQGMAYALPPLPGPQLNGARPQHPGGQQSVLSFAPGPQPPLVKASPGPPVRTFVPPVAPAKAQSVQHRIPQVDGPSESSDESPSPPSSQSYAPHASHPSLPQPSQGSSSTQPDDSEAINSDLDDSDTEGEEDAEEGTAGETDIVFCTYDKVCPGLPDCGCRPTLTTLQVARVKNKWKCILKDGMIHINGRDYLFAKCTGYVSRPRLVPLFYLSQPWN